MVAAPRITGRSALGTFGHMRTVSVQQAVLGGELPGLVPLLAVADDQDLHVRVEVAHPAGGADQVVHAVHRAERAGVDDQRPVAQPAVLVAEASHGLRSTPRTASRSAALGITVVRVPGRRAVTPAAMPGERATTSSALR